LHLKPNEGLKFNFKTACEAFKMIDDETVPILVQYDEGKDLIQRLQQGDLTKDFLRKSQRFSVNVYRNQYETLLSAGDINLIEGIPVQINPDLYHPDRGLETL
jgi:CRISPR-associated endonuclease/helicase Cas3